MRGRFWCKFRFLCGQNLWVMGVYGILEVWVKRGSTVVEYQVCPKLHKPSLTADQRQRRQRQYFNSLSLASACDDMP
jgi:hypothetical protein